MHARVDCQVDSYHIDLIEYNHHCSSHFKIENITFATLIDRSVSDRSNIFRSYHTFPIVVIVHVFGECQNLLFNGRCIYVNDQRPLPYMSIRSFFNNYNNSKQRERRRARSSFSLLHRRSSLRNGWFV